MAHLAARGVRVALRLAHVALVLAVLWQGARLVFRPDPLDGLRRADALFLARRYYDALEAYRALVARDRTHAAAYARLGMVYTLRGELPDANRALGYAIGLGLEPHTLALARLYQAQLADSSGAHNEARQFWELVDERSPLAPLRWTLEGESLLRAGRYAEAEQAYLRALQPTLPARWRAAVHTRLATLRAPSDPAAALADLERAAERTPHASLPIASLAEPLLAPPQPDAGQLAAALRADPTQRHQLLGQLYLAAGLYPLADRQFAAAAPGTPDGLAAAAYRAYTHWAAGDRAVGLQQLEQLVAAHPDVPRARALLALAYLATQAEDAAEEQVRALRALDPSGPDTHLVMGAIYAARRDYVAAAAEYDQALRRAPPAERGPYALAAARFHIDTSLQACDSGLPAAEEATRLIPTDASAWSLLAAARLACGEAAAAVAAAREALRLSPTSPEAAYHLGRALAAIGDRDGARQALVSAADLAPSSTWRQRAERQLAALGL